GRIEVALLTSSEGNWVFTKGNPIVGLKPHEVAAHEAEEEAGIIGDIFPEKVVSFLYAKRASHGGVSGTINIVNVWMHLYILRATQQHDEWKEKGRRTVEWVSLDVAASRLAANVNIFEKKKGKAAEVRQKTMIQVFAKVQKKILAAEAKNLKMKKPKRAPGQRTVPAMRVR
ncbi:MAG: hypothetical protein KGI97_08500, partial [Alphaproteobacteria bacterium]|nr:hypothetical protein [Alphaproteobacteria bacterium]